MIFARKRELWASEKGGGMAVVLRIEKHTKKYLAVH
jgi:hypothetical protein